MAEAEGIADGYHPFADFQFVRISQAERRKIFPVALFQNQFDQGNIGFGIGPNQLGVVFFFSVVAVLN